MHIIHIRDRHSAPPRLDLTTHTAKPTLQPLYDPTKIAPHQTRLARHHPLGEGHEQAGLAPTLEQGTEPWQLPKYGLEDLQQISEQSLQVEKSPELGFDAWKHPASRADLVTHSMYTFPPATYTPCTQPPRRDNDSPGDSAKYASCTRSRGETTSSSWKFANQRKHPEPTPAHDASCLTIPPNGG